MTGAVKDAAGAHYFANFSKAEFGSCGRCTGRSIDYVLAFGRCWRDCLSGRGDRRATSPRVRR